MNKLRKILTLLKIKDYYSNYFFRYSIIISI